MIDKSLRVFDGGIASFYEDFTLWVPSIEREVQGYVIFNNEDPTGAGRKKVYRAYITHVIRKGPASDAVYNECILRGPDCDVSGEFVTDKDIYYCFFKQGSRGMYYDDISFIGTYEC